MSFKAIRGRAGKFSLARKDLNIDLGGVGIRGRGSIGDREEGKGLGRRGEEEGTGEQGVGRRGVSVSLSLTPSLSLFLSLSLN